MKILKFNWFAKELFINLENNKLQKGKVENAIINYDLSKEESNIIDIVFKQIASNNYIHLKDISYNNNSFAHLLNSNNLNIFFEIKDKHYDIPNEADLKILNFIYNNQERYSSFKLSDLKEYDFYQRIVKIGKKAIPVLIAANIAFTMGGNLVAEASVGDYEEYYNSINNVEEITLTYNDIVNLVNTNPNLSNEEKNVILSCKEYFNDNLAYLDHNHISNMLKNLKIAYKQEDNGSIKGLYNDETYQITIYNSTSFNDANISVLTHEISHALAIPPHAYNQKSYGQNLIEALNVIVNNEYFGQNKEYDISYPTIISYAKIMAEIIEPEVLKQAFFKTDISLIENYLVNIINDEAFVKDLLTAINTNVNINNTLLNNSLDEQEKNNLLNLAQENNKLILNNLKLIYETKTNESIESNEEIMYWYNKEILLDELMKPYFPEKDIREMTINCYTNVNENKTYFANLCSNTKINLCKKITTKYYPLSNMDIEAFKAEGAIKEVNGKYIISQDYQNNLILKNNQLYTKGYAPLEYMEYELQSHNLKYEK